MTPEQRETWKEHQERLYAMAVDDGETWDLSENDQAACNAGGDAIMTLLDRAALRAPAVTGEAKRALEAARSLLDVRQGHDSDNETGEHYPDCARCKAEATVALIDAALAGEAAPPAAGAPPALVALVDRWRGFVDNRMAAMRSSDSRRAAELDAEASAIRCCITDLERAIGSPAPAPVAPPAETCGASRSVNQNGAHPDPMGDDVRAAVVKALIEHWEPGGSLQARPGVPYRQMAMEAGAVARAVMGDLVALQRMVAPPAVAGGDAPERQVGDRILSRRRRQEGQ